MPDLRVDAGVVLLDVSSRGDTETAGPLSAVRAGLGLNRPV
ncbi:hypothetical protein [Nocardia amamiensis]|nr:hypothetical protein [Nocardia amamiensis]